MFDVLSDLTIFFAQACAITVYLGTTLYDSSKFRSTYGLAEQDGPDAMEDRRKSRLKAVQGAILGAAAGGAA